MVLGILDANYEGTDKICSSRKHLHNHLDFLARMLNTCFIFPKSNNAFVSRANGIQGA